MALDKQRILSELGSVMNQLQSADCGCMNKVFSKPGQGGFKGAPLPTCGGCRRGTCPGHGYPQGNMRGGGDPCSMNMQGGAMNGGGMPGGPMNPGGMQKRGMCCGCMGRQAPKLYADTYNYLNENLMQPTMKEVYNDLSTITPENTIGANPLAAQMGVPASPQGNVAGQMPGGSMGNPMQNMSGAQTGASENAMSAMGAQILNMMMKGGGGTPTNTPMQQQGQPQGSMLIDAPNSPHGQVGVTPVNQSGGMSTSPTNQGQNNASNMGMTNLGFQNPVTQYVTPDNMYSAHINTTNFAQPLANRQKMANGLQMSNGQPMANTQPAANAPLAGNEMPARHRSDDRYVRHINGVQKFHEMFPGVNKGGDLNFDPMAIAIQMNPANQQRAAIESMNKMMSNNNHLNSLMTQPTLAGSNAAATQPNQNTNQQGMVQGQQQATPGAGIQSNQQLVYNAQSGAPVMNQQMMQQQPIHQQQMLQQQPIPPQQIMQQQQIPPQQVVPQQQMPQQQVVQQVQSRNYQQGQLQQQIEPNTGAVITPGYTNPNTQMLQQPLPGSNLEAEQEVKEPLLPANTHNVYYNTLGQPVNMLPGKIYSCPMPGLPQTLGGVSANSLNPGGCQALDANITRGYGVKNIPSKTVLAGTRSIGSVASRSQLQHIYRQFKASHSATQQHIRPLSASGGHFHGETMSAGNINGAQVPMDPAAQIPVEKVGGDTLANDQMNQQLTQQQQVTKPGIPDSMGDVPANPPPVENPQSYSEKSLAAVKQRSGRNGMQDSTYTPYRSPGWSFHG